MREFDELPPHVRAWLAHAALPWRPRSVLRAYKRAYKKCGNSDDALAELDRLQTAQLAKDMVARRIANAGGRA